MAYFDSLLSFVKIGHLVQLLKRGDTNTHADSRDISLVYLLMERKYANITRENYRGTALKTYFEIVLSKLIISNEMQHKAVYLLFCKFTPHVLGVNHTHHQEYIKL